MAICLTNITIIITLEPETEVKTNYQLLSIWRKSSKCSSYFSFSALLYFSASSGVSLCSDVLRLNIWTFLSSLFVRPLTSRRVTFSSSPHLHPAHTFYISNLRGFTPEIKAQLRSQILSNVRVNPLGGAASVRGSDPADDAGSRNTRRCKSWRRVWIQLGIPEGGPSPAVCQFIFIILI